MTGEYMNIAVYSYDLDDDKPQVYSKFLKDWTRVNDAFNIEDDKIFGAILDSYLKKIDTKEALQEAIKNSNSPYSSLMFTAPRASLLPGESLAEDMAKTFLVE